MSNSIGFYALALATVSAAGVAACTQVPTLQRGPTLQQQGPTGQQAPTAVAQTSTEAEQVLTLPTRTVPVVPGRPARLFVFAAFDDATCAASALELAVQDQPAKGQVEFRKGHRTKIASSRSGKCIGQSMIGTAIYYTARPGASGEDTFSVSAKDSDGQISTQRFEITLASTEVGSGVPSR